MYLAQTVRYRHAVRARELGIAIGGGSPGPLNAITDFAGVRVRNTVHELETDLLLYALGHLYSTPTSL